jgi:hypothetical protein
MTENIARYPFTIDPIKGRAHIILTGEIILQKVQGTFLFIALHPGWHKGDGSIIWQFKDAYFNAPLEFGEAMKKAQAVKHYTKPGKTVVVLEKGRPIQQSISAFYKSLAQVMTERRFELFDTMEAALTWLDA